MLLLFKPCVRLKLKQAVCSDGSGPKDLNKDKCTIKINAHTTFTCTHRIHTCHAHT